jgi:hypothetical protein
LRLLGFFEDVAASTSKNKSKSTSTSTSTNTSLHKGKEEGIVFETAGSQEISPALAAWRAVEQSGLQRVSESRKKIGLFNRGLDVRLAILVGEGLFRLISDPN